jgi:hypothetical protein
MPAANVPASPGIRTIGDPVHPPQRVLFFGKSMSRSRCTGGLVDGLRKSGLEVRWRNLARLRRWFGSKRAVARVRREFDRWSPDLVFVFCTDVPISLLHEFRGRAKIVQWFEEAFLPPNQVDYMRLTDLVCVSNPGLFPQLHAEGIRHACFQMSGFSTRFHFPARSVKPVRDLAFIGSPGLDDQRARFLIELADRFCIDVFGKGWDRFRGVHPRLRCHKAVGNRAFRRICAESRIVLGMNQLNSSRHYFSNRVWLTLACRGFHLMHYVPGIESVLQAGEHLDWFHDVEEAARQIEFYLERPEERDRIAEQGWHYAMERHQYAHRIRDILNILADPVEREARAERGDPSPAVLLAPATQADRSE